MFYSRETCKVIVSLQDSCNLMIGFISSYKKLIFVLSLFVYREPKVLFFGYSKLYLLCWLAIVEVSISR